MYKAILISIVLALAGCGPANIQYQRMFRTQQADGQTVFHFDGYTDRGETAPGAGKKYLEEAAKEFCPNGAKIINEAEVGAGKPWPHCEYWYGEAKCNEVKADAHE